MSTGTEDPGLLAWPGAAQVCSWRPQKRPALLVWMTKASVLQQGSAYHRSQLSQVKPCKPGRSAELTKTSHQTGKPPPPEASHSSASPVPASSVIQGQQHLPGAQRSNAVTNPHRMQQSLHTSPSRTSWAVQEPIPATQLGCRGHKPYLFLSLLDILSHRAFPNSLLSKQARLSNYVLY